MGTNYYHVTNVCEHCGRGDGHAHIGKSSIGWTFSFQGTDEIRSYEDWLAVLEAGGIIEDEYGCVVSLDDFKVMVEAKRRAKNHHDRWMREHYPNDRTSWTDEEGNSFSLGEFS